MNETVKKLLLLLQKCKEYLLSSKFRKLIKKIIATILFAECLFYIRWKYLVYYVNNFIPNTIIPSQCSRQRFETIMKYALLYNDYNKNARIKWIKHVFNDCELTEIKKENVIQILGNRYFLRYDDKTKSNLSSTEIEWRDGLILKRFQNLEKEINYKFEEGYNPKLIQNKYQNPSIKTFYHPLCFYLYILFIGKIPSNFVFLFYLKFRYKYVKGLKIWYKLNDQNQVENIKDIQEPILFFGGVSAANPAQAAIFVNEILKRYKDNKSIFVIQIPWSEMKIDHFIPFCGYINNQIPLSSNEISDIIFELENMVLTHNRIPFRKSNEKQIKLQWNLVGQSFGTFICSIIYQRIKHNKMGVIPRLILIAAPTLCMTDPRILRLTGKAERDWKKYLFQLFVGRELMIVTTGAKYVHWFEYCLFPHELVNDGCNKSHIVVSGTNDHLIPLKSITKGIEEANKLCDNNKIIHIIMKGMPHGVWLSHIKYQNDVIDAM